MKQEIKAIVNQDYGDFKTIYLVKNELGKIYNGTPDKYGNIKWKEVIEGSDHNQIPPLFKVNGWLWQDIVDAMVKQTPPRQQERIEGELDSTKYHLEDLRKLLKLKNK
jgi:hypothetical protein